MTAPAQAARAPGGAARWHVVARVGEGDAYQPAAGLHDRVFAVAHEVRGADASFTSHDVWDRLDEYGLVAPPVALDLYRAAATVFAADMRIQRERAAFDRWTRDLVLHLPVHDLARWQAASGALTAFLRFLTGDHWTVQLRRGAAGRPPVNRRLAGTALLGDAGGAPLPLEVDAVSLFSGGLDSLIGAVDGMADGRRLALVSHHALGSSRFSSTPQQALEQELTTAYGEAAVRPLRFSVTPPRAEQRGVREPTQRSRSILFFGLGTLVASALGPGIPLVIPENGFIGLNVPLTPGRLGTLSTRTTHPHTVELFRAVLDALALDVPLELPYRFRTKGQMLLETRNPPLVARLAPRSHSCGRPNDPNVAKERPEPQCGYCVPCIIRRAAMAAAGLDVVTGHYRFDVHAERALLEQSADRASDVRAFETALARTLRRGAGMTDVLTAGHLPDVPHEVEQYVRVYLDGLDEVGAFLQPTVARPRFASGGTGRRAPGPRPGPP